MPDFDKTQVKRIIVNSGENELAIKPQDTLGDIIDEAAGMLNSSYLNNYVLVEGGDGKLYAGEFLFELRPVSAEEAKKIAEIYGEEPDDV